MPVFELFSKRQKKQSGNVVDVYTYDSLPNPLRVQIVHIWNDLLGNRNEFFDSFYGARAGYKFIVETLCREYGLFHLPHSQLLMDRDYHSELINYFMYEPVIDRLLDVIELTFVYADTRTRNFDYLHRQHASESVDRYIEELNTRFMEHGFGYRYESGRLIRVDAELIHAEIIKPALTLLSKPMYSGAMDEFLKAHEHYRTGRYKEALTECSKSIESTMIAICSKRKWKLQSNPTFRVLVDTIFENGLVPSYWQQLFTSLRSTLENGVAPARNRMGGHGQGEEVTEVPRHIVGYVIHMTASAILFLGEAEQSL